MVARLAAAVVILGVSASAMAAVQLASFEAGPISKSLPEIKWDVTQLVQLQTDFTGSGSLTSGDGDLPVSQQAAPGLSLQIPAPLSFVGSGLHGMNLNTPDGSTLFYDTSLVLSGWERTANATSYNGVLWQPLGPHLQGGQTATFSFYATHWTPTQADKLLLQGYVDDATLIGLDGGGVATILSNTVHYTGGAVYDQLIAQGGDLTGKLSWTLDLSPDPVGILQLDRSGANIAPFNANMSGLFNVNAIPEPATLSMLGIGCGLLMLRARRRKA